MKDGRDDDATRLALGAGFVLLCSVFGGFALAYALSLTIGGIYVPVLMPIVVGLLLGTIGSFVARRFRLLERRPVVLSAILGALIAYLGYHALAYLRVLQLLAAQWAPDLALGPGSDPPALALAAIEQATGESGWIAYLTFVSEGSGVVYSPLGLFGRTAPGVGTSIVVMLLELGLAVATAVYAMLWRTRAEARQAVLAKVDDAALAAFREALGRADWDGAGRALAASGGDVRHAITLESAGGAQRLVVSAIDHMGRARALEEQRILGELQAKRLGEAYSRARLDAGGQA
ncbi:MAG: hypothetical protein IT385_24670 [Deltaproteobacteria bacterium]|nr:hypothetical protein [Deltaproteobacteria bacterium]